MNKAGKEDQRSNATVQALRNRIAVLEKQIGNLTKIETALRESEDNFRDIFETVSDGIVYTTLTGRVISLNRNLEKILGIKAEEVTGESVISLARELLSPRSAEKVIPIIQSVISGINVEPFQFDYKDKVLEVGICINLNSKRLTATLRDITERVKTQDDLSRNEARLKRAELASMSGNWELHLNTGTMYGSVGAMKLYGVNESPLDYSLIKSIPLPEYRPMMDKALEDLIKHGKPYNIEFKIRKADTGDIIDIHSISEYDKERNILFGAMQDITDRKRAEDEIKKKNLNLARLLEITIDLIETVDKKTVFKKIVEGATSLIGLDTGAIYAIEGERLYLEGTTPSLPEDFPEEFRNALLENHPLIREAVLTNRSIMVSDLGKVPLSNAEKVIVEGRKLHSILFMPLIAQKKAVGVLMIGTCGRQHEFREHEIDLCRTLSNIASLTIENTILFEKLNQNVNELKQVIDEKNITSEALRESEHRFRSLFENNLSVMLLIDPVSGLIVDANRSAEKYYGWKREELLKLRIQDINILQDEVYKEIAKVLDDKERYFEFRHRIADGSLRDVEVFSSKVLIDRQPYLHSIIFDITERKLAGKRLKLLNRAIEQSPVSIVITDPLGNIEYVNPKFTEITGYSFEEALGNNPRILKSGSQPEHFYKDLWNTILSGKDWFGEIRNKKKNGDFYWESVLISPLVDKNHVIEHFVAVKEDITEKKEMIEKLVIAKEKAEESDRLKTAFLHNISHEIRTPLNAIIGFSGFLNQPDITSDERKEYIDIIFNSNNQLLSIINDILNISQIEAGQVVLKITRVNISKVLRNLQRQLLPEARKKNLELMLKEEPPGNFSIIETDESKLIQVISNLLTNAIKFTSQGSVEFGVKEDGETLVFYISDTGIGIPEEEQEKIFERFYQVDKTVTRNFGGTGLGLSISKAYVELLGGKIWLESGINTGSVFYFSIPHNKTGTFLKINPSGLKNDNQNSDQLKTIMVAEDEDSNYMLIAAILRQSGLNIIRAVNGQEAVDTFKSNRGINLILMDIKMPVKGGLEAVSEILQIDPDIPIIAQTAYAHPADKANAIEKGCVAYLAKPFRKQELIDMINKFMK